MRYSTVATNLHDDANEKLKFSLSRAKCRSHFWDASVLCVRVASNQKQIREACCVLRRAMRCQQKEPTTVYEPAERHCRPPAALPRNHEAQYYSAAGRGRSVSREAAAGVSGEPVAADGMAAAAGGGTLPPRRRQPKKRTYSPGGVSEGVAAVGEEPEGEARLETSAQRAPRPAGASPLRRRVATSGASARRRRAAAAAVPAAVGAPAASNTLLAAAADMLAAGFAGKPLAPGAAELLEDFAAAGAESGGGGGGQAMAPEVVLPLWGARAKRYK